MGPVVRLRAGFPGTHTPLARGLMVLVVPSGSARRHSAPVRPLRRRGLCGRPGSKWEEEGVPGGAACAVRLPARSRGACSGLLGVTKCRIRVIGSVLPRPRVQNAARYWVGRCPPVSAVSAPAVGPDCVSGLY